MKKLLLFLIILLFSTGFRGGCKKIFKIVDNQPSPAIPVMIKKTVEKKDSTNSSTLKINRRFNQLPESLRVNSNINKFLPESLRININKFHDLIEK